MEEMARQVDSFLSNFSINIDGINDFRIGYSLMKGVVSVNRNDCEEEQIKKITYDIARTSKPFLYYTCGLWLDKQASDEKIEAQIEKFSNQLSNDENVVEVIRARLRESKGYPSYN
ncbi:MAG TPA: hypothetical protein VJ208_03750 [Candidatus Nanoarchaeia archaeon]|nr:hypothetical protein [Candidatus Nanoarchaeia archaeon]